MTLTTQFDQTTRQGRREVFDLLDRSNPIDSLGSRNWIDQRQVTAGFTLVGTALKTLSYTIGGRWVYVRQRLEDGLVVNRSIRHRTHYVTPTLTLRNSGKRVQTHLTYNYRVVQPSFQALDPIPDYRRPELIIYGNPQLKAALAHSLAMQFMEAPKTGGMLLSYRLNGSYHTNRIVQDVRIQREPNGLIQQQVYFRNLSGDMELSGSVNRPLNTWELPDNVKLVLGSQAAISLGRERYYNDGLIERSFLAGGGTYRFPSCTRRRNTFDG